MKKFLIFLMIAIFALSCFSGCNQDMGVSLDGNGVYLDYATGLNADGNFNNELYSYNQMDAVGSDPGVIYVSKEQDAEYGGYPRKRPLHLCCRLRCKPPFLYGNPLLLL